MAPASRPAPRAGQFKRGLNCSSGKAPLTREPSAKNVVGVPRTISFWPRASSLSSGTSQFAVAGFLPRSIQSSQVAPGSFEHHTSRTLSLESGDKMG